MGKQRYNEVLARIRWNPETSAVGIFSDTDESRYVAQIYAEQIKKTLQQKTGKLPESLPENYDPPIYYYLPGNSKNFKLYSKEEQRRDREKANLLLKDKKQREMAFEIGNFACLLLAGDPNEVLSMQYNGKPIIIELIRLRLFHIADSMVKCVGKNNIVDYLKEHDLLKMAANQFLNNDQCLIEAINMNRPDIVKHIITLAPHLINQVDSTENELTPLLLAATLGYKDITNLLLTHGAQIEKKDKVGDTVLKSAAFLGHEDVVELLLQKGAKLEDKNNVGTTALMYAASSGETNVIELLLKKGAKLEEKDNIGHTALMYASVGKKKDAIQLLLTKGAKLEEKNKVGCTALMCSVLAGQIEFIELLLEKGAKLEEKDNTGHTALMHAVERGQIDIIELLLKKGAKLEEKNKVGHTALMCAAVNGKLDVVTLLLKRGAKIEAHDNNNKTVLTCAAEKGQKEVVELLLANGANVNARAIFGYTVLMHAVLKGRKEVVDLLLTKGADVYAENNAGNTALTLAVKNNQKEVVAVLQQHLLTKYLAKTKQRESTHHLNSWSIFGKTINFGYSAGAKVAAAEALYAVLNQGADQTSLRDHLAVLANGELGKIYKACCDVGLIDKKIVSPGLHFFK
jgi:ankyrin repeat protein